MYKILLVLTLIIILLSTFEIEAGIENSEYIARVAPEIIKWAHKYHSINFAKEDKNHHWFFIRDDKHCSLFTKDFLIWYGRGELNYGNN